MCSRENKASVDEAFGSSRSLRGEKWSRVSGLETWLVRFLDAKTFELCERHALPDRPAEISPGA